MSHAAAMAARRSRHLMLVGAAAILGGVAATQLSSGDVDARASPKCQASSTQNPVTVRRRASSAVKTLPISCRDGTKVFPWAPPSREEQIEELKSEKFDVLVIGGGCVGSAVALDAATRGLRVALVERDDYAAGTSGRSTKLIHGGVRYLENAFKKLDYGQYELVREALEERAHMLSAAPYIAKALPIMVPVEKWWQVPYYWVGTKLYDFVAGDRAGVPRSMFLSREQACFAFPMLDSNKLAGAMVYYDGQMNDTRYSLMILLTAIQAGATAANHVNVERLLKFGPEDNGRVRGAVVRDSETGEQFEIRASAVVNATGPFSDAIRRMAATPDGSLPAESAVQQQAVAVVTRGSAGPGAPTAVSGSASRSQQQEEEDGQDEVEDLIVPAGGIHVALSDDFSPSQMGLVVPATSDGRVLFFLPWSGSTLVGTTDSETPITMLPRPSSDEVDFVLSECGRYLNRHIKRSDVRAAWSGIRPLVRDLGQKGDTKALSREHVVELGSGRLVTIGGGKWTTQRRMAEDTVDAVLQEFPRLRARAGGCATRGLKLLGADRAGIVCEQKFNIVTVTLREDYGFDRDVAEHLVSNYGTRALQIAEIVKQGYPSRGRGLHPKRLVAKHPFLEAEVVFAAQQEYALTAEDVLARRTRLAYVDYKGALEALPLVVDLLGKLRGWSRKRKAEETQRALEFLDTMKCPAPIELDD